MKNRLVLKKFFTYFFAFIVFLIMFFPLYGLILTSIQPENIIRSRNLSFFPTEIIFTHFVEVLKPNHISNIYEGIKNSLIVSSLTAFLCLILGFPASYSLSRFNMPAKNLILGVLISVYFLPTILFVIRKIGIASIGLTQIITKPHHFIRLYLIELLMIRVV